MSGDEAQLPENLPTFLKSPHWLFTNDEFPMQLRVLTVPTLTISGIACDTGFTGQFSVPQEVLLDSSGPRVHLASVDGKYRIEIPFYGTLPPFSGSFVVRRHVGE